MIKRGRSLVILRPTKVDAAARHGSTALGLDWRWDPSRPGRDRGGSSSTAEENAILQVRPIRIATVAAIGVLSVLWGNAQAGQDLKDGAAAQLEVRVLEAQVPPVQEERYDVLYRMEVISVLRSTSPVKPGGSIVVRSYALSPEAMDRGGMEQKAPEFPRIPEFPNSGDSLLNSTSLIEQVACVGISLLSLGAWLLPLQGAGKTSLQGFYEGD